MTGRDTGTVALSLQPRSGVWVLTVSAGGDLTPVRIPRRTLERVLRRATDAPASRVTLAARSPGTEEPLNQMRQCDRFELALIPADSGDTCALFQVYPDGQVHLLVGASTVDQALIAGPPNGYIADVLIAGEASHDFYIAACTPMGTRIDTAGFLLASSAAMLPSSPRHLYLHRLFDRLTKLGSERVAVLAVTVQPDAARTCR